MKKVLILGASGMAGHVIYTYLNENLDKNIFEIYGTTNNNDFAGINVKLDIFDSQSVLECLDSINPDYVINCVGMLIKSSQKFPDKTIFANSYFPHFLARLSIEKSFKLIHISTDCVFSGKDGGYTETSVKDATDLYGMSKSLGEIVADKNLTIRTSIIGPEIKENGEGLFDWFMKTSENSISGYKSNFWSGVTTLQLADFIFYIIKFDVKICGLYHLTNNESISKYNLLNLFNKIYDKDKSINSDKDYVCNKSFVNTNHKVPYEVASYQLMLENQKEFMRKHLVFYKHYK